MLSPPFMVNCRFRKSVPYMALTGRLPVVRGSMFAVAAKNIRGESLPKKKTCFCTKDVRNLNVRKCIEKLGGGVDVAFE